MSASETTKRTVYGICVLLDSTLIGDLTKYQDLFTKIKNNVEGRNPLPDETGIYEYFVLKNTSPEIEVKFYLGVGDKAPKIVRDKIQQAHEGGINVFNSKLILFSGQDYTKEQMVNMLKKMANYDDCRKIFVVDLSTSLTGNFTSKFGDI